MIDGLRNISGRYVTPSADVEGKWTLSLSDGAVFELGVWRIRLFHLDYILLRVLRYMPRSSGKALRGLDLMSLHIELESSR